MRPVFQLIALIVIALPLGGCHVLLLFPCLLNCSTWVTSLPPRNDPLARALKGSAKVDHLDAFMTTVSRTQFEALGRQWPQPVDCLQSVAVGCRYSIAVKVDRQIVLKNEPRGCGIMDVAVEDGADGLPVVRRTRYRDMACPPDAPRPAIPLPSPPE
jgi:hypothetical protein